MTFEKKWTAKFHYKASFNLKFQILVHVVVTMSYIFIFEELLQIFVLWEGRVCNNQLKKPKERYLAVKTGNYGSCTAVYVKWLL